MDLPKQPSEADTAAGKILLQLIFTIILFELLQGAGSEAPWFVDIGIWFGYALFLIWQAGRIYDFVDEAIRKSQRRPWSYDDED